MDQAQLPVNPAYREQKANERISGLVDALVAASNRATALEDGNASLQLVIQKERESSAKALSDKDVEIGKLKAEITALKDDAESKPRKK
jgi:predicted  nucleic acid-binding Zn-ribbon protein